MLAHQSTKRRFASWWWRRFRYVGVQESVLLCLTGLAAIPAVVVVADRFDIPFVPPLLDYLSATPWLGWAVFIAWLTGFILIPVVRSVNRWAQDVNDAIIAPTDNHLFTLMHSLNQVVGVKKRRFDEVAQRLASSSETITAEQVFTNITKPELQYREILFACWSSFVEWAGGPSSKFLVVQVILARMGPNHVEEFLDYYPSDREPRTMPKELQHEDSAFSRAKQRRSMVVVDAISQEREKPRGARDFHFPETAEVDADTTGTILCYPVTEAGVDVPLVLSVHINREHIGGDDPDVRRLWEHILHMFALRLSLEYRLTKLRDATGPPAAGDK